MQILFKTAVEKPYNDVIAGFTLDLFERLSPKSPPVNVKRFDGCKQGDEVHIEMVVPVLNRTEEWISRIVKAGEISGHDTFNDEWYFIDEGVKLPFFLTYWRHVHRVVKAEDGSAVIIDDIEYRSPWYMMPAVHLVLSGQFAARQPIYREYFKK